MKIKQTDHCSLCELQKIDFINGSFCGVTNKKPAFDTTCSKIKLTEKFEEKIKEVNINYEKVRRHRIWVYLYFILFLAIATGIIFVGYYLWQYISDINTFSVVSVVPFIIMSISVAPLGMAFGALNDFNTEYKISKAQKQNLDRLIKLYNIDYRISIKFGKEYHGRQDVRTNLELFIP